MKELKRYLDGFILGIFRMNKYMTSIGLLIFIFDTKEEYYNPANRALFHYFRTNKTHCELQLLFFIKFEWDK